MWIRNVLCASLIVLFVLPVNGFAEEGNVTITTYYPAPHGVYKVFRLYPHSSTKNPCAEGDMYYSDGGTLAKGLYVCNSTPAWQLVSGGGVAESNFGGFFQHGERNTTSCECPYGFPDVTELAPHRTIGAGSPPCGLDSWAPCCELPHSITGNCTCPPEFPNVTCLDLAIEPANTWSPWSSQPTDELCYCWK